MNILNIFLILSSIANLLLFIYICLIKNKNKLFLTTLALQLIAVVWSFAKLAEINAPTVAAQWVALQILHSAINFAGPVWCLFCDEIINRKPRNLVYLFLFPGLFEMIILFRADLFFDIINNRRYNSTLLFTIFTIMVCIYGFKGIVSLVRFLKQGNEVKRKQIKMILAAFCIPFFLGILSSMNVVFFNDSPLFHHIPTAGFSLTVSFMAIAILRYHFLDISSIASSIGKSQDQRSK